MTAARSVFCLWSLAGLLAAATASAQGLIAEQRLAAGLANEAVGEAVAACAKNGYAVTAIVVDIDGVRQAVLRGDGAPVHTLDSAYAKAYTAASLTPVRKESSTKEIFERISKNPSTTASLGNLPNVSSRRAASLSWPAANRSAVSASAALPAAISTTNAPVLRSTRSRTG
jgi:uncharacterized protein GlcG (DUF336 family)